MAYIYHFVCKSCGTDMNFSLPDLKSDKPISCSSCGSKINPDIWKRSVDIFWMLDEINHDLRKNHLEKKEPLFEVSMTDTKFDAPR